MRVRGTPGAASGGGRRRRPRPRRTVEARRAGRSPYARRRASVRARQGGGGGAGGGRRRCGRAGRPGGRRTGPGRGGRRRRRPPAAGGRSGPAGAAAAAGPAGSGLGWQPAAAAARAAARAGVRVGMRGRVMRGSPVSPDTVSRAGRSAATAAGGGRQTGHRRDTVAMIRRWRSSVFPPVRAGFGSGVDRRGVAAARPAAGWGPAERGQRTLSYTVRLILSLSPSAPRSGRPGGALCGAVEECPSGATATRRDLRHGQPDRVRSFAPGPRLGHECTRMHTNQKSPFVFIRAIRGRLSCRLRNSYVYQNQAERGCRGFSPRCGGLYWNHHRHEQARTALVVPQPSIGYSVGFPERRPT